MRRPFPQPQKGTIRGKALRRRLSLWQHGLLREAVANKAQERGMKRAQVDPRYTSKTCPHCGYSDHADHNAALNIRNKFTVLRDGGDPSVSPEAQSV